MEESIGSPSRVVVREPGTDSDTGIEIKSPEHSPTLTWMNPNNGNGNDGNGHETTYTPPSEKDALLAAYKEARRLANGNSATAPVSLLQTLPLNPEAVKIEYARLLEVPLPDLGDYLTAKYQGTHDQRLLRAVAEQAPLEMTTASDIEGIIKYAKNALIKHKAGILPDNIRKAAALTAKNHVHLVSELKSVYLELL